MSPQRYTPAMSHTQQRHVSVERAAKVGAHRLYCRRCELGVEVPLSAQSLLDYERTADNFLAQHRHPDRKPERLIDLI